VRTGTLVIIILICALLTAQARAQSEGGGFLGLAISEPAKVTDAMAQQSFGAPTAEEFLKAWRLRVEDRGALVLNVLPGHAAEQVGIIPGDLIVALNGVAVVSSDQFQRRVGAMQPGAEVGLALLRGGRNKQIAARLGRRPAEYPAVPGAMPEFEARKVAPPSDVMSLLVTPEESAKALGDDFSPAPAENPDYDAAVKLYRESRLATAEGLVLAGPIAFGADGSAVARVGDEVLKLNGKPIATPVGFAFEILKYEDAGKFPLTLDLRGAEGTAENARTVLIQNARDADRAAAALFFTDEDRVLLWLLDFFPPDSAKNAEEQKRLCPQSRDGASFPFPAEVFSSRIAILREGAQAPISGTPGEPGEIPPASSQPQSDEALLCAPGDILVRMPWRQPDPNRFAGSLLFIHDGRRTLVEDRTLKADFSLRAGSVLKACLEPARLQARQLLECIVAARELRLTKLAEDAAAFLPAAYPDSKEAAALSAHDRAIQLAAWHARLREGAAAGDIRPAIEAARALLRGDSQGRYGREAKQFMDCVNAAAGVRIARAEKLLDAGDAAGARREAAPVARAVPEDARLAGLLGRCDDVDTLQFGRGALDKGQLRHARLMAEAVLARNPNGAEAKPAQQLLDAVRSSAKSRTDRANRLLDAGDADSAREELAPALQAFPDDPAALAAWNRSQPPAKKIPPEK